MRRLLNLLYDGAAALAALGMVLLALTLGINAVAWGLTLRARRAGFA